MDNEMDYKDDENEDGEPSGDVDKYGSCVLGAGESAIHCLTIIGQIEGHQILRDGAKTTKYEHLMPIIAAVEESSDIRGLLVLLNTAGGDVEAGLAIAELIAGMTKPTASVVLGGGHSIGVPLAVAAKRSFIAPSAAMILHPVRMNGIVIAAPQSFSYLKRRRNASCSSSSATRTSRATSSWTTCSARASSSTTLAAWSTRRRPSRAASSIRSARWPMH